MAIATREPLEISFGAVSAEQREKNRQVLQPILYDLIAFARVLKQLHWNVIGPNFRNIHLQLDDIYEVAEGSTDTVAERLSAVGVSPNGRIKDVAKNTEIDDVPEGFTRDTETLLLAEHRTKQTIENIRSRMAEIEDVDTVTADMLHQICASLEKLHWMLQAHRV
jgi:starvation-inducible DNA-binding protein